MKLARSRIGSPQRRCRGPHALRSCRSVQQTRSEALNEAKSTLETFRLLAFLTEDGRIFEQAEIEERFTKTAREIGGTALVLLPPAGKITAPSGWRLYDTFRYSAAVLARASAE